jgi:uncharacterized protein YlxW (UPF0749 family)
MATKKASSKRPAGAAKRLAAVQRQLEKLVAAQTALQEAVEKLAEEIESVEAEGGKGQYNPRLLSVVPVDMNKLLKSIKKS